MLRRFLLLCCAGLCSTGYARGAAPPAPAGFAASSEHGRPARPLAGVWRTQGYGYVLDVGARSVDVYDEAGGLCWRDRAAEAAFATAMPWFRSEAGGQLAVFAGAGDATRIRADRLDGLPPPCRNGAKTDAASVFDALWVTLDRHYAFFDRRGVDWKARQARYRPQALAAASDDALFDVLLATLDCIDDPHLSLRADIDGRPRRRSFGKTPSLAALRPGFEAQKRLATTGAYYRAWTDADFARIGRELLGGNAHSALDGNLLWGRAEGGVGYLALRSMQGFADDSDDARDLALLAPALDRALADLRNAPVLIVDVAANLGGSDAVAQLVASRFADRRRPAYSKRAQGAPADAAQRFDVVPAGPLRFEAPVYLLTSDLTMSAAEVFVLAMRALPQVTQVGATTRGAFSDVLQKTLPNGWTLGLSNETYADAQGRCFEGVGLEPARAFVVFEPARIDDGHAGALKKLVAEIRR